MDYIMLQVGNVGSVLGCIVFQVFYWWFSD
jgi:hypothetical protein